MKHHLKRAKRVYDERGLSDLLSSAIGYVPIEVNNAIFRLRHDKATKVMDEDWDTLVLLDACRYDMFEEQVPFEGKLESQISLGSTSEEFLAQNFSDGEYHDTVYVNSNAYLPKLGLDQDKTFHAVIDLLDDWNNELETAHPETVTEAALKAHANFPNKRLIIHYMQPHIPFIGKFGQELQNSIEYWSVWKPLRKNNAKFSHRDVWKAYKENLDIVFEYVRTLINEVDGKTVLSADHGNMIGERHSPIPTKRFYGHPWGVYTPELVRVPWFEIESVSRRDISEDPPKDITEKSDEVITDRLQALGYAD